LRGESGKVEKIKSSEVEKLRSLRSVVAASPNVIPPHCHSSTPLRVTIPHTIVFIANPIVIPREANPKAFGERRGIS
jgi:hypothetical protein